MIAQAAIIGATGWLLAGVVSSFSEPDIWTHHRTGKPTLGTGAFVIAAGPLMFLARPLACFGMRNLDRATHTARSLTQARDIAV